MDARQKRCPYGVLLHGEGAILINNDLMQEPLEDLLILNRDHSVAEDPHTLMSPEVYEGVLVV